MYFCGIAAENSKTSWFHPKTDESFPFLIHDSKGTLHFIFQKETIHWKSLPANTYFLPLFFAAGLEALFEVSFALEEAFA